MTPNEVLDIDGSHSVLCECEQCIEASGEAGTVREFTIADCVCVLSCEDAPETQCYLSGQFHVHSRLGHCPVHPDADES